jgi:hypothetical protein
MFTCLIGGYSFSQQCVTTNLSVGSFKFVDQNDVNGQAIGGTTKIVNNSILIDNVEGGRDSRAYFDYIKSLSTNRFTVECKLNITAATTPGHIPLAIMTGFNELNYVSSNPTGVWSSSDGYTTSNNSGILVYLRDGNLNVFEKNSNSLINQNSPLLTYQIKESKPFKIRVERISSLNYRFSVLEIDTDGNNGNDVIIYSGCFSTINNFSNLRYIHTGVDAGSGSSRKLTASIYDYQIIDDCYWTTPAPKFVDQTICINTNTTINPTTVTNVASPTYNFYATATSTTALATGISFTTPLLSKTTTYYVSTVSCSGEGYRFPVTINIQDKVALPKVTPQTITVCPNGNATFTASTTTLNPSFTWSTGVTGKTLSLTGITTNAQYTVYATAPNLCKSDVVTCAVIVTPTPSKPIVTNLLVCKNDKAELNVTQPTLSSFKWFDKNGVEITTGITNNGAKFTIPKVTENLTFTVVTKSSNASCSNSLPTTVNVTIKPLPNQPIAQTSEICYNTPTTLTVNPLTANYTYKWYPTLASTTPITTGVILNGAKYNTPNITSTTSYFVEAYTAECSNVASNRVEYKINVIQLPELPNVLNVTKCSKESKTLEILSPNTNFTYNWYLQPTGGTSLGNGSSFDISNLSTTTIPSIYKFYVAAKNTCGESATRKEVLVTVNPAPDKPTITGLQTICVGTSKQFNVSTTGGKWTFSNKGFATISPNDGFVTGLKVGTEDLFYTLTNSYNCSTIAQTSILVKDKVKADINVKSSICVNSWEMLEVVNIINPTNDVLKYSWDVEKPNNGGQLYPSSPGKTYVLGNTPGTSFTVLAIIENECGSTTIAKKINVNNAVQQPTISCVNPSDCNQLTVSNLGTGYGVKWNTGETGSTITRTLGTGNSYTCTVTSTEGCTATGYWYPTCTGYDNVTIKKSSSIYERKKSASLQDNEIKINVFPNPSNGNFSFDSKGYVGKAIITNSLGAFVQEIELKDDLTLYNVELKDNVKGIYNIHFEGGEENYFTTFIIE